MADPWQVACILREPISVTTRFVSWYLAAGADQITLYFDDPEDPAISGLQDYDRLKIVRCTPEFWASVGLTPEDRFTKRQNRALTHAYQQLEQGWLFNVDSDELLYVGQGVGALLADQPAEAQSLRIKPVELLCSPRAPGGPYFRSEMDADTSAYCYGKDARKFGPRRRGLMGHTMGKSFVRAGVEVAQLRQHQPQLPEGQVLNEVVLAPRDDLLLMHCLGESFRNWRDKVEWRLSSRGFSPQLASYVKEALAQPEPLPALRQLYRALYHAAGPKLDRMRERGVLFEFSHPDVALRDMIAA